MAASVFKSSPIGSLCAETGIIPRKYHRDVKIMNYFMTVRVNEKITLGLHELSRDDEVENNLDDYMEIDPTRKVFFI